MSGKDADRVQQFKTYVEALNKQAGPGGHGACPPGRLVGACPWRAHSRASWQRTRHAPSTQQSLPPARPSPPQFLEWAQKQWERSPTRFWSTGLQDYLRNVAKIRREFADVLSDAQDGEGRGRALLASIEPPARMVRAGAGPCLQTLSPLPG